tara:strand:+ start:6823 stop:7191 length:369 start_codon:yes stop_codon:yes gene_type:complete
MKKILYTLLISLFVVACMTEDLDDILMIAQPNSLNINAEEGLRFQNSNINDGDKFNLKVIEAGNYLIEIEDHFKNVISKSTLNAKSGDNVYTFYTRAFQDGDYTITISLNGDTKHNVKYTIQ